MFKIGLILKSGRSIHFKITLSWNVTDCVNWYIISSKIEVRPLYWIQLKSYHGRLCKIGKYWNTGRIYIILHHDSTDDLHPNQADSSVGSRPVHWSWCDIKNFLSLHFLRHEGHHRVTSLHYSICLTSFHCIICSPANTGIQIWQVNTFVLLVINAMDGDAVAQISS